ncbi:hypothetical protein QL285_074333 [Trifolium repens]|nr:hypothetical protein QL285_074333 [Trifolium repens]
MVFLPSFPGLPNSGIRAFWFDSGGGSSAVKFRLEKIGGKIMFGFWKIKSRMCLCNQGYTRSVWRGGGKNTQRQPGEAVAIILGSTLACKEILSRWSSMCSYGISAVPCKNNKLYWQVQNNTRALVGIDVRCVVRYVDG